MWLEDAIFPVSGAAFCGEHIYYSVDLSPVLCQEATNSMYSSRVSLHVVMPWCVVAYPWEGILVYCPPLVVAALHFWGCLC